MPYDADKVINETKKELMSIMEKFGIQINNPYPLDENYASSCVCVCVCVRLLDQLNATSLTSRFVQMCHLDARY